MKTLIIFKNLDNTIQIITPSPEALAVCTIDEIARKDVPAGMEYWLVSEDEFPTDRIFRDSWELDASAGNAVGVGDEGQEFPPEVLTRIMAELESLNRGTLDA